MIARLYGKNIFFFVKNTAERSSKVAVSIFIHKAENGGFLLFHVLLQVIILAFCYSSK